MTPHQLEAFVKALRTFCIAIAPSKDWLDASIIVCDAIELGYLRPHLVTDFMTENLRRLAEGATGGALDRAESMRAEGDQEELDDQLRLVEHLKRAAVTLGEP
jgi:hypothetical protein